MKLRLFFLSFLLLPFTLDAMSIEEEASKILGQSYNSEAAKIFFKKLQIKPDFPTRSTFTYNFYEKGLSVKVTGTEFIQAIQVYNKTMLFKAFPDLVYGKKLTEIYGDNDIYKVIKMAPIAEDKASGTFIYPNKKPADYLIRIIRKPDNTMRTIAWMMDENVIEKIIAKANPQDYGKFNSHDEVWDLLGKPINTPASRNFFGSRGKLGFNTKKTITGNIHSKKIGMYIGVFSIDGKKSYKYIEFKRRGQFGTQTSFPHALPEGLHWWSSPETFEKVFNTVYRDSAVGAYTFKKETKDGTMTMHFSMGILSHVKFVVKQKK